MSAINFSSKLSAIILMVLNCTRICVPIIMIIFSIRLYFVLKPVNITLFVLTCSIIYLTSVVLTTMFHEIGHMVFGFLSGYQFFSIQLFGFKLSLSNNHFIFEKILKAPINAQCIMIPPINANAMPPYLLYNSGGILFSMLQIILCLVCLLSDLSPYINFIIYNLLIQAIFSIIFNLLPYKKDTINDGRIIYSLFKNDNTKSAYYWHLHFYKELNNGVQPGVLLESPYLINLSLKTVNIFSFDNMIVKYYGYLDKRYFLSARDILVSMMENYNSFPEENQTHLFAEYSFMQIILNETYNQDEFSDKLIQYLKNTPLPFAYRILIAYFSKSGQPQQCHKYFSKLEKMLVKNPLSGLTIMEYELSQYIINSNLIEGQ